MPVLDVDSVMLGDRIRRLILNLQRRPHTAIIQSLMSTFRAATRREEGGVGLHPHDYMWKDTVISIQHDIYRAH